MSNLQLAFPEKTVEERKIIAKKFYRNLCDTFLEAIKLLSMSSKQLSKRFSADYSLLHHIYNQGKSCQIHLGHNFNWEWGNAHISLSTKFNFLGVYMPIETKSIDRFFKKLRSKFGTHLLAANNMRNAMLPYRDKQYTLALIADQNPSNLNKAHWVTFFGKQTPFLIVPEKNARRINLPVVFATIKKIKRGYYQCIFKMLAENPIDTKETEITTLFVRNIENYIKDQPENWLWSHRRWKHAR